MIGHKKHADDIWQKLVSNEFIKDGKLTGKYKEDDSLCISCECQPKILHLFKTADTKYKNMIQTVGSAGVIGFVMGSTIAAIKYDLNQQQYKYKGEIEKTQNAFTSDGDEKITSTEEFAKIISQKAETYEKTA